MSSATFLLSLTQPAFYIDRADYDAYADGRYLLLLGWMGILGGSWESLLWWANPLYFLSLYWLAKNNLKAGVTSTSAFLMALLFSVLPTILVSESGARAKVTSLEMGYWLWGISFLLLTVGSWGYFLLRHQHHRREQLQAQTQA